MLDDRIRMKQDKRIAAEAKQPMAGLWKSNSRLRSQLAAPLETWRRLRRDKFAVIGGAVVVVVIALTLLAPVLPLADPIPKTLNTTGRLKPPFTPGYPLGADELGRDVLSRMVWGARTSLLAGFLSAVISVAFGVAIGLIAGFRGGRVDDVIMRLTDILMAFPGVLLSIAIAAALGPGLRNAMIAVSITGIPLFVRVVRASVLALREREFVLAAHTIGCSGPRIVLHHILPNVVAPVIVMGSLDVGNKIIATASLSFLGLGTQPPAPDWGNMLASGRQFISVAPHLATIPGIAIFVVVLGLNLLGDGLRDALDPTLRQ